MEEEKQKLWRQKKELDDIVLNDLIMNETEGKSIPSKNSQFS